MPYGDGPGQFPVTFGSAVTYGPGDIVIVSQTDPGDVGAGKVWVQPFDSVPNTAIIWVRDATNSTWNRAGQGASQAGNLQTVLQNGDNAFGEDAIGIDALVANTYSGSILDDAASVGALAELLIGSGAGTYHWTDMPGASVGKATQNLNNGSFTTLTWDVESYDIGGFHSGGAPTRLTIPTGGTGRYLIGVTGKFEGTGGASETDLVLCLNGAAGTAAFAGHTDANASVVATYMECTAPILKFTAGDFIEAKAFSDRAGLTFTGGFFSIQRMPGSV